MGLMALGQQQFGVVHLLAKGPTQSGREPDED